MRKIKAWLVSDCGGQWSDAYEVPVRAFTSREMAEECARKRERRAETTFLGDPIPEWCILKEIEVIIDE